MKSTEHVNSQSKMFQVKRTEEEKNARRRSHIVLLQGPELLFDGFEILELGFDARARPPEALQPSRGYPLGRSWP